MCVVFYCVSSRLLCSLSLCSVLFPYQFLCHCFSYLLFDYLLISYIMIFGSLFDLVSVIIFSPRLFASRLVSSVVLFTSFLLVLSEEMLHLSDSARFSAQWISQQLPRWRAGAAEVGFPPSCFVQSTAAQKTRTRQGVPADGFALPEFSVTTPVLLYLLCRWTHTLKDHQRQCAESILRHLIGLIPSTALQWHFTEQDALEHAFPAPPLRILWSLTSPRKIAA